LFDVENTDSSLQAFLISERISITFCSQDHQARKMAGEYYDSLKQRRNEQEEEELLELISDLEIESEQIVQYHGTLQ